MPDPIFIAEYNPEWPILYEQEKQRILDAIGDIVKGIEHVGSTSVPGLAAKPTIDILVGVFTDDDLDRSVAPMESAGFPYLPKYEEGMPYRRLFHKRPEAATYRVNVHLVRHGHEFWERDLLFRDYLRAHPETAAEYEHVKRQLATQFDSEHVGDYADAKTPFIRAVEERASRELKAKR
jgi:GrpB-like predicted nucleotidyltransferase (UPF0157 family)